MQVEAMHSSSQKIFGESVGVRRHMSFTSVLSVTSFLTLGKSLAPLSFHLKFI